jgi:hypothetical protein
MDRRALRYFCMTPALIFCSHAAHLAHFSLPMLEWLRSHLTNPTNQHLAIFSGHDVNLLGLLYALGAYKTLHSNSYWPEVGSVLLFECKGNVVQATLNGTIVDFCVDRPLKSLSSMVHILSDDHFRNYITLEEIDTILREMRRVIKLEGS